MQCERVQREFRTRIRVFKNKGCQNHTEKNPEPHEGMEKDGHNKGKREFEGDFKRIPLKLKLGHLHHEYILNHFALSKQQTLLEDITKNAFCRKWNGIMFAGL